MSEQGTPSEGQPAVAGPEGTPGAVEPPYGDPSDPYEKRYNDLRSWTDRVSQEASQLREEREQWQQQQHLYELLVSTEDPDTRREIAEALGYVLEEEQQPETDDPLAAYDQRIGRIEQSLSEREQEQADQEYAAHVRQVVDQQLGALGLNEEDGNLVFAYALHALPITEDGLPDIQQAYEVFMARETERQKAWAQSKRAPHLPAHGQSATEVPNLDDRQTRQDWMVRRLQESEQAGY